jgi:anti-anti-sigma regulatory factor
LLYTDGLLAGASAGRKLDARQLTGHLASASTGAGALAGMLEAAGTCRSGAEPVDDITLLLLEARDRPSTIDNGLEVPLQEMPGELDAPRPHGHVLVGEADNTCFFIIQGEGDWTHCTALHNHLCHALQAGRDIAFDLSGCLHLDSTFLGTILEAADLADDAKASLAIHGMLPTVRSLFDELGMSRVVAHAVAEEAMLPPTLVPLESITEDDEHKDGNRVLAAHKALASLDARNRAQFASLIAMLELELRRA